MGSGPYLPRGLNLEGEFEALADHHPQIPDYRLPFANDVIYLAGFFCSGLSFLALRGSGGVFSILRKILSCFWSWLLSLFSKSELAMPQPLSSFKNPGMVQISNVGDYPLQRHEHLATLAAEAIASWSNVESFQLSLFMTLLGGPGQQAADIYLALKSRSAKGDAIKAAAKSLPPQHEDLLRAILSISSSLQQERDAIAHGIFGDCTGIPDALLIASPRDMLLSNHDYKKIYVYREGDFKRLITANEKLAKYGRSLRFILSDHPANKDNQLYDELCAEPEIQKNLVHQAHHP